MGTRKRDRIDNESKILTVKKEVHKEASTTGKQNIAISKEDAKDLEKAVKRDTTERINSTQRLDSSNLDKVKQGCQGIGCSNQEYDDFLKNILKGK